MEEARPLQHLHYSKARPSYSQLAAPSSSEAWKAYANTSDLHDASRPCLT